MCLMNTKEKPMNDNVIYYLEVENSAIKIMKIIFSYGLGQFWLVEIIKEYGRIIVWLEMSLMICNCFIYMF